VGGKKRGVDKAFYRTWGKEGKAQWKKGPSVNQSGTLTYSGKYPEGKKYTFSGLDYPKEKEGGS